MHVKTVLITGANGGLGRIIVNELLKDYNVVGVHRRNGRREELAAVFEKNKVSFDEYARPCELTNDDDVKEMAEKVISLHGIPWGIINLAGGSSNSMSWKTTHDQFMHVINDNLMSAVNVCRHFVPFMRQPGCGGRIVNVSSVVALSGAPGAAHYAAAKAGIIGYTKSLALELASRSITANTVALGYFDVGLIEHLSPEMQENVKAKTPLQRFGRATEAAGVIRYLLSEESAFMTGQVLNINGGIL